MLTFVLSPEDPEPEDDFPEVALPDGDLPEVALTRPALAPADSEVTFSEACLLAAAVFLSFSSDELCFSTLRSALFLLESLLSVLF